MIEFVLQDMGYWLRYYVRGGFVLWASCKHEKTFLYSREYTQYLSMLSLGFAATLYVVRGD